MDGGGVCVSKCIWVVTSMIKVLVTQSHLTLCNPMSCSSPGSSVHRILQARILEWVAIPFSRRSLHMDQTWVSCTAVRFFTRVCVIKCIWVVTSKIRRSWLFEDDIRYLRQQEPACVKLCGGWGWMCFETLAQSLSDHLCHLKMNIPHPCSHCRVSLLGTL